MTTPAIFIIKQNDTLPNLTLAVKTKGRLGQIIPYCLSSSTQTGATTCTFSMQDSGGNLKVASSPANILDPECGIIEYSWQCGDTDEEGLFLGEFEITFPSGKKISVPSIDGIDIRIVSDINQS